LFQNELVDTHGCITGGEEKGRERLDLIDFPLGDMSVMRKRKRRRWSV